MDLTDCIYIIITGKEVINLRGRDRIGVRGRSHKGAWKEEGENDTIIFLIRIKFKNICSRPMDDTL